MTVIVAFGAVASSPYPLPLTPRLPFPNGAEAAVLRLFATHCVKSTSPSTMPTITLPDGSQRQFANPVTGAEVAAAIGPGLAKAALAVKLNGQVKDLATSIREDAKVEIVTKTHKDALELLRHDAAHVLAEAVQELFPGTQITFGPATESGFYYDFHRAEHFTLEDFEKIEQRMREIVDRDRKSVV